MKWKLTIAGALVAMSLSCNEFEDPPPASPTVPDMPLTQFNVTGRWDGMTNQGRPLRFDVSDVAAVLDSSLSLHHDCTGGRLVLKLAGYEAQLSGDTFSATINWRVDEDTKFYVGTLTVSGRFESDTVSRGGWVNSITDKQADNLGVCEPASGNWQAGKH